LGPIYTFELGHNRPDSCQLFMQWTEGEEEEEEEEEKEEGHLTQW
jgi:Fe-S-cluster containining protein